MDIDHTPAELPAITPVEAELVRKLRGKHPSARLLAYERYGPTLYTLLVRWLKDPSFAQKALEKVFEKLVPGIDTYDEKKGRLFIWLLRLCQQTVIELESDALADRFPLPYPESPVSAPTLKRSVNFQYVSKIYALDARLRAPVLLYLFYGLNVSEIAALLRLQPKETEAL